MIPPVRSRLLAAGTTFAVGFLVASAALLLVPPGDRRLLLVVGIAVMLTGAVGVLVADAPRRVSPWSWLGLELLAVFTLFPVLWMLTLATSGDDRPTALTPDGLDWGRLEDVWDSAVLRDAFSGSLASAGAATVVALLVAAPGALAVARHEFGGRRVVVGTVLAALLVPYAALVGPWQRTALALDLYDTRRGAALAALAITLPLAWWLLVVHLRRLPWTALDTIRADGATLPQRVRAFWLPLAGPRVAAIAVVVLLVACVDLSVGLAVTATSRSATLPAAVAGLTGGDADLVAAATGLLWLVPVLVVVSVLQRPVSTLLGRTYR